MGLISDTHDNEQRTRHALSLFRREDVDAVVHCGDLTSKSMVPFFDGFECWIVRGNVDRDPAGIRAAVELCDSNVAYAGVHELELGGARVGVMHGDDGPRLLGMIGSGAFDLVLHGHTHAFRDERIGRTRVVNPGAVHRSPEPSVCTYETDQGLLERHLL